SEPEQPELAEVVRRLRPSMRHQRARLRGYGALRRHADAGNRLTELIDNPAGDHAAARQGDVNPLDDLALGDLDRPLWVGRPPLPVGQRDETALADRERVAASAHLPELVGAAGIGGDGRSLPGFCDANELDLRVSKRLPVVGCEHVAAQRRGTWRSRRRWWLR